ncbi:MAG TPA: translation elongation factor Ts [Candidatus Eubacterium pullicola]|uniref:Elongation factor Ts n=1 Tax=Gallibacter intestinalis TaxID=2779356 RepID=A0ABR9QVQ2_9FIRM|nr:translation elongation factor Ts [Gallibacter intestinalis]MBE5034944.1 elongation factor Ts [Gallibacter intestinalis]HIW39666.1 translation elongation factor Ts [Candidatus Eubacterium pullicola]
MAVTAALVKELREITGAGMMDCKKALVETDGDIDKAIEYLREKGLSKAAKKSDRIAAMGLVRIAFSDDCKAAALVEVNSETDFVAKNDEFITFVENIAKIALENDAADVEALKALPYSDSATVGEELTNKIATIGENLNIRRFVKYNEPGVVYAGYTHTNGMIGVIVGIKTDATADEIATVGKDVSMQVASMNPQFLDETSVDPAYIEHEREILRHQVLNEGKPENMVDKIVDGKIKKELKEVCLVDQKFVKNGDLTVKQYVDECAKEVGKDMAIASMVRYEVGEGIEKKEEDFAAEVAAQQAAAAQK